MGTVERMCSSATSAGLCNQNAMQNALVLNGPSDILLFFPFTFSLWQFLVIKFFSFFLCNMV